VLVLSKETGDGSVELPTEFRIFGAGMNETSQGSFLFDELAARSVMAEFQRAGVDLMIDLNHESLDEPTRPDSHDARGYCKLEVRGGELWAVDVKWSPDGARRLRERSQKYVSPAVLRDKETKRVQHVLNVALVAMPATYNAQPLVAASRVFKSGSALEALSKILQFKISRSSLKK
jgi:phage I-like protein